MSKLRSGAAAPGPGWMGLPLPALILDAQGCIAALNDIAEVWLNLSRKSAIGEKLEGGKLAGRLRIDPPLSGLAERVAGGEDVLMCQSVRFDISDRAGGHAEHMATVYAGPCASVAGAVSILIAPAESAVICNQNQTFHTAARSAIGMAEMLAHEIKNPLAGIRGAAQLIAMNASAGDRDMAELIVSESRRIVSLLEQVERFGDTSPPKLAAVNVHDVLEQVRRSATVGFARGIKLQTDYDPSLPSALADADQLMQVCLNLLKNAAEAVQGGAGHAIKLRTAYDHALRLPPGEAYPDGRFLPLQIIIEDDGPGLPEAIAGQIFEPFISGRENGTGLGLALVSKIIAGHGALIRAKSRPGKTTFTISLPRA